jgi:DNA-binding winged helix-turn-helix (wHTH) protein
MAASAVPPSDGVQFGDLLVNYGARSVTVAGQPIPLTRSEFDLLARLTRTPGVVVSSKDLLGYMWDEPWMGDETSIETHVSRLRRKLGETASHPRYVKTIRGVGYKFDAPPSHGRTQVSGDEARRRWHRRPLTWVLTGAVIVALGIAAFAYLNPSGAPGECAPGYQPCLPIQADLDCPQIRQLVTVTGDDAYGLDRDGDGIGCQIYGE